MMTIGRNPVIIGQRKVLSRKFQFWTAIHDGCLLLCEFEADASAVALDFRPTKTDGLRVTKGPSKGRLSLVSTLPDLRRLKGAQILLEIRYLSETDNCLENGSLLSARENCELRTLPITARTREATSERQIVDLTRHVIAPDQLALDGLVVALDLRATAGCFTLLEVRVSAEEGEFSMKGAELVEGATMLVGSTTGAGARDVAGLVQLFEAHSEFWARKEKAFSDEIDELRREIDEAYLKAAVNAA